VIGIDCYMLIIHIKCNDYWISYINLLSFTTIIHIKCNDYWISYINLLSFTTNGLIRNRSTQIAVVAIVHHIQLGEGKF